MDAPVMEPWQVYACIKAYYSPEKWKKSCQMSGKVLMELIGAADPLDAVQASRIPKGTATPENLRRLHDRTVQARLAQRLGLPPDIFNSRDEADLTERLRELDRATAGYARASNGSSDCLVIPRRLSDRDVAITLHDVEQAQVEAMVRTIFDERGRRIINWTSPEPIGAGMLTYAVAGSLLPVEVRSAFLVRPFSDFTEKYVLSEDDFDLRTAFDEGLRQLADKLGIPAGSYDLANRLLAALEERHSVLFICNCEVLPRRYEASNLLMKLLSAATRSGPRKRGDPAPICLVGQIPDYLSRKFGIEPTYDIKEQMTQAAARRIALRDASQAHQEQTRTRVAFFRSEWHRHCQLRDVKTDDWLGPRLKAAEWFYDSVEDPLIWPSAIRMRAFIASNYQTASCFDPTQGWIRLAGMPVSDLPIDIRLILDEVVVQVWRIHDRSGRLGRSDDSERTAVRQPDLRAMRWISTSIYWLTQAAVSDLTSYFDVAAHLFLTSANRNPTLVRIHENERGEPDRFRSSLPAKAIIQDRWRRGSDRVERHHAHYAVARRLWRKKHDKEALHEEYPMGPHYGRHRLVFLAETLRHLMRACDGVEVRQPPEGTEPRPACEFPEAPDEKLEGVDVAEVVNFCFSKIYWEEINGNSSSLERVHQRKLGRLHGLYSLAAELLELMSEDGRLGEPHRGLHPAHHARYYREVAFAQLDIGDLVDAERNVRHLVDISKRDGDAIAYSNANLDLVVVLATRDDLQGALAVLNDVDISAVERLPREPSTKGEIATHAARLETLAIRLKARRAQLLYLSGQFDDAFDAYSSLRMEDLIRTEVAHPYIALLGAKGGAKNLEAARSCASEAAHYCYRHGYHHERMGYQIAIAHIRRKLGGLREAEQILDEVNDFIQQEGCSERTYLAFLLEAGRVVMAQGRFARAYTVYLRPCLDRAFSRGYRRVARTAHRHAQSALTAIPGEIAAFEHSGEFATKLSLRTNDDTKSILKRVSTHEPKYAFGNFEPGRWFASMSEEMAIREQLNQLERLAPEL